MNAIIRRNRFVPRVFQGVWDDDFWGSLAANAGPALPAVNVTEKDNEFAVDISVPGFSKDDIDVEVDKNTLKISGKSEQKSEEKDSNDKVMRQEFTASSFERSFILPENIDTESIAAKQENGVLKITLPKKSNAKEDLVKKIAVTAS